MHCKGSCEGAATQSPSTQLSSYCGFFVYSSVVGYQQAFSAPFQPPIFKFGQSPVIVYEQQHHWLIPPWFSQYSTLTSKVGVQEAAPANG